MWNTDAIHYFFRSTESWPELPTATHCKVLSDGRCVVVAPDNTRRRRRRVTVLVAALFTLAAVTTSTR